MPFFEYECPKCGYHDEVLQMIGEKPLTKCPNCGKSGLRKLMSAPVFRLKGSGWYETDFKSDKEDKRNLAGTDKEESKSDDKDKKDAKPDAAKPDAKPEKAAETTETSKPEAKATSTRKPARTKSSPKPKPRAAKRSRR